MHGVHDTVDGVSGNDAVDVRKDALESTMPDRHSVYVIRDLDTTLWRRVKSKAAYDGITLKALLAQLLAGYVGDEPDAPAVKPRRGKAQAAR